MNFSVAQNPKYRIVIPLTVMFIFVSVIFVLFPQLENTLLDILHARQNKNVALYVAGSFIILSLDIILPVPSSIVMFINGLALGTVLGGLLSLFSSITSAIIGYVIGASVKPLMDRFFDSASIQESHKIMDKYGDLSIILSRGIPILSESISVVCGNNAMTVKKFVFANVVGYLPLAFIYAYLGSISLEKEIFAIALGINVLIAGLLWISRKYWT